MVESFGSPSTTLRLRSGQSERLAELARLERSREVIASAAWQSFEATCCHDWNYTWADFGNISIFDSKREN